MQFFLRNGQWIGHDKMKKINKINIVKKDHYCPYCVSKGLKHRKECPSLQEGFNALYAHVLTPEEREELTNKYN